MAKTLTFVQTLAKAGYTVYGEKVAVVFDKDDRAKDFPVVIFKIDADEEQPELFMWCVKEIEKRVTVWDVQHGVLIDCPRYKIGAINKDGTLYETGWCPTMTQCAMDALVGVL